MDSEKERKAALDRERGRRYRERHPERVKELARARMAKRRAGNPDALASATKRHVAKLRALPEIDVLRERSDRFWSLVDRRSAEECWEWLGPRTAQNYGRFNITSGYWRPASRVACMLTHGPMSAHEFACHTCDNPPCCNPAHLYIGTAAKNVRDKIERGRHVARVSVKLTPDQIEMIRSDPRKQQEIADEYGISRPYVSKIRSKTRCSP